MSKGSSMLAVRSDFLAATIVHNGKAGSVMSKGSSMLAIRPDFLADTVDGNSGSVMSEGNIMLTQSEILVHHNNLNIQRDVELWNRIREYDQKAAEDPSTPVQSKKQKQKLRQHVLGKPPYRTHSNGCFSKCPMIVLY
jgi:hypothetical protein